MGGGGRGGRCTALVTTALYSTIFCLMGFYVGCKGPLLLTLAEQTGGPVAEMGAIFTSFSAGQLTFACLSGPAVDKGTGHTGLAASLALAAAGVAGMPLVQSFPALLLCTAAQGAGIGFMDAGSTAMLMWLHPTNAGPYMQGAHAMFGVGAVISPVLVGLLSHDADGDGIFERSTSGWPSIMYGTALCLLGCVGCLLILPSPRPPAGTAGNEGAAAGDSVYSSVDDDDETESLVGGGTSTEKEHQEKRQAVSAVSKPDTLAVSWPVVVSTAVVLAFYLGAYTYAYYA
jgi:MFS family permease